MCSLDARTVPFVPVLMQLIIPEIEPVLESLGPCSYAEYLSIPYGKSICGFSLRSVAQGRQTLLVLFLWGPLFPAT